jgi:hypothetical protein
MVDEKDVVFFKILFAREWLGGTPCLWRGSLSIKRP